MISLERQTPKRRGAERVIFGVYDGGSMGLLYAVEDQLKDRIEHPQIGQGFADYEQRLGRWSVVRSAYEQDAATKAHPVLVEQRAIEEVRPGKKKNGDRR